MTDLHTHILPGMDDGAPNADIALSMLRMQSQQGVETVALTPHFYRTNEGASDFLARRSAAWNEFRPLLSDESLPSVILGSEVAWVPGMAEWPELDDLCYENTRILLVELPIDPWDDEMFRQLYSLSARRGVTPMIAHLDRYFGWQKRKSIEQLLSFGFPVQVSCGAVCRPFHRNRAIRLLREYGAVLISDCHNITSRPPNMDEALKVLRKKLGNQVAEIAAFATDEALLD